MRLFIGLPFDEKVGRRVHRELERLRPEVASIKETDWRNYHLTLKFLGETEGDRWEALRSRMKEHRFRTDPFPLELTGLGHFSKRGGDVLWLGVTLPPELFSLHQEAEALTQACGFDPEPRGFSPHLTLGRGVRYRNGFDPLAGHWSLKGLRQWMDRVVLYESTRVEGRLTYRPLLEKQLGQ